MSDEPIEGDVVDPEVTQNLPAVRASEAVMARGEITVDEMVAQKGKIVELMNRVMDEGKHYGKIPGVSKPTLLKPGAEAINVALRLAPDYDSEKIFDGPHLTVFSKCTLRHIPTGLVVASGEGMCSSMESKYAWRTAKRQCPDCGAEAIIKGKAEYGGGWVCWKKEGGCGHNFQDDDGRLTSQSEGKVENPDLPDTWNTVLKMADKRALVAAVLNGTAASDVFTQDVEDAGAVADDSPAATQPQVHRVEGVQPFPVPKNWKEIEACVRTCDNKEEAWALFQAFGRAASNNLFGQTDLKKLDKDQKMVLVQKAAGAAVWLNENIEYVMGELFIFDETKQRLAWKHVLNTDDPLEIPDYEPPEKTPAEQEAEEIDEEAARIARETFAETGQQGGSDAEATG